MVTLCAKSLQHKIFNEIYIYIRLGCKGIIKIYIEISWNLKSNAQSNTNILDI